jgi:pyridoxine kinase
MIREVLAGIGKRGVLGECDGVLSGYMGSADIGAAILETVATVKQANAAAQYCCDPVIGDVGRGVFVREGIPEFMRDQAVPAADIITPNQFELEYLAGHETRTMAQAFAAIDALHHRGPRAVMVTSLHTEHTPADCIDLLASDDKGRFRVRTPKLPLAINGAGDAIAALFFAHYLREGEIGGALSLAASAIFGILCKTLEAGSREILLVTAQEEIVKPSQTFEAERLGAA